MAYGVEDPHVPHCIVDGKPWWSAAKNTIGEGVYHPSVMVHPGYGELFFAFPAAEDH